MLEINKNRKDSGAIWAVLLCLPLILYAGCEKREKVFTVGMATYVAIHESVLEGFKAGMAEYGYVEGRNIRYIYDKPVNGDEEAMDAEIKKLLSQGADLLLTVGNELSPRAKKAVEGTGIPVVAASIFKPVEIGLMESVSRPGGNITGVLVADTMAKTLEMLVQIFPETKVIYVPYNPVDRVSSDFLEWLKTPASQLGIKIIDQEVHSVEDAVSAIKCLPEGTDAIYRVPSPTLDVRNNELSQAAIERGIAMVSMLSLDESVLISLAADNFATGRQAAGITHKIMIGAKPAEMPLASTDLILTVNLKTAEKIGVNIPDGILYQAKHVIR